MKKISLLIAFLVITSSSFSENIIGKWNFNSILYDSLQIGKNIKDISKGDALQINNDGSFNYLVKQNGRNLYTIEISGLT